jgi:3'(2'), 5'-bisphosphate nucleotidase
VVDVKGCDFTRELNIAAAAAIEAGALILGHYKRPPEVQFKGMDNPVTSADREASALLVRALSSQFPDDEVLSEELPASGGPSGPRRWIIDPLDGTQEFIRHVGEFSVMIGLVVAGRPALGIVYQPITRKLYYATTGAGAFLKEDERVVPLHVSMEKDPARMTAALSRSHHSRDVDRVCQRLRIGRSIVSGSLGLKIGLICEGRAHLYIHSGSGVWQWDTCAPEAILTEAGGRMTNCEGTPLLYGTEFEHSRGVLASAGVVHERLLETISDVRSIASR